MICKVYPPVFLEADGLNDTLCQDEITAAAIRPGKGATLSIPENMQKSWTPKEPWLYPYSLEYGKDRILGYFALRKCDVQIADDGYPRFFLNNQPYCWIRATGQTGFIQHLPTKLSSTIFVQ